MSLDANLVASQADRRAGADLWRLGVLPVLMLGTLSGLLGIYWDIAWHVDIGRDSFFTPPHNFIYGAMLITLLASLYGLIRDRRATPLHLPFGRWRLHPGVMIVVVGAVLVLFFAPADDLWHRLFGADVTLWAPMHLVGVLGLTLLSFGGLVASWVERRLSSSEPRRRFFGMLALFFAATLLGWFMLFLAEFEFNVPAFPMLWHPLLLVSLPSFALVLIARLRPLPLAATWAALLFTALRLLLAGLLIVTSQFDWAGLTRPMIPLLILSGVAADLLVVRRAHPLLIGLLLGAVGFLANWPLARIGEVNWYPGAVAVGLPIGLLLSVLMVYLGLAVADALEPRPRRSSAS